MVPGICLIGCGTIAASHAKRLKGRANLWFHSRSRSSAEALNRKVGGAGVFGDLGAGLDSDRIDAVMVASPPDVHAEQAVRALEAGKFVFVEKPLCLRRDEIGAIEQAVGERPPMVGENYYYKPSLKLIRSWIDAGEIGTIQRVKIRKCSTQTTSGWKSAYGALFEGGIHFVALLNGLIGPLSTVVDAEFPTHRSGEAERRSTITLAYGDVEARLEYAWDVRSLTQGLFQHSCIEGDAGRIVFESNGIYVRRYGRRPTFEFPGVGDLMGAGAMTDDMLACIASGQTPISNLERASQDLETVFQAYESAGLVPVDSGE